MNRFEEISTFENKNINKHYQRHSISVFDFEKHVNL